MLIIGHRGSSAIYPENTRTAFEQALSVGAHGLELDIQCSSDGKAIIFHDDTLERMTNGTGNVCDHTFPALQALHVEGNEHILSLQEMFALFAGKTTLWLEIKDPRCIPELVDTISIAVAHGKASYAQCVVIGFDADALAHVHHLNPEIILGLSIECIPEAQDLAQQIATLRPAYLLPHFELANEALVHDMAAQGIQVIVWTLNEINDSLRMQQRGVAGIITDVPTILHELFHG
jgi:glycerophosphoryl diester phosphodiesterase